MGLCLLFKSLLSGSNSLGLRQPCPGLVGRSLSSRCTIEVSSGDLKHIVRDRISIWSWVDNRWFGYQFTRGNWWGLYLKVENNSRFFSWLVRLMQSWWREEERFVLTISVWRLGNLTVLTEVLVLWFCECIKLFLKLDLKMIGFGNLKSCQLFLRFCEGVLKVFLGAY